MRALCIAAILLASIGRAAAGDWVQDFERDAQRMRDMRDLEAAASEDARQQIDGNNEMQQMLQQRRLDDYHFCMETHDYNADFCAAQ